MSERKRGSEGGGETEGKKDGENKRTKERKMQF